MEPFQGTLNVEPLSLLHSAGQSLVTVCHLQGSSALLRLPQAVGLLAVVGGIEGASLNVRDSARIYVVASAGGVPRQLQPDFVAAAYPVWSPGGDHLLFLGNPQNSVRPEETVDWWVTPLSAGPAIKTGALEATRRAKLSGDLQVYPWALVAPAWEPDGRGLVFSSRSGDSTNLWRISISPKTWKVTGPPQRLTSGLTREESPSVVAGANGRIRVAFASMSENFSIWSLAVKTNEGKVAGKLEQLTHDAAGDLMPALSRDGNRRVYVSLRPGNQEVWIKDLRTGQESALTASRSIKYSPTLSQDGSLVSFAESPPWNIYVVPSAGGSPEMVCEGCGEVTDWSPDGKRIIGNTVDGQAWVLDLASRRKTALLATHHWTSTDSFSPDGRWLTFLDATVWRAYVAPFRGEGAIPESAWVAIMDGEVQAWSPDGNLVYVSSSRDGFRCIWAQRLDPATRRPVGEPFPVFHSHDVRISLKNQAGGKVMCIGRDRAVLSMGERTGNIWMAEFRP
jgi:Tol biopolymer transport system component